MPKIHDFSELQGICREFSYTLMENNAVREISVDMDRIEMRLMGSIPTVFKPTGEVYIDEAGQTQIKSGLQKVIECYQEGKPNPTSLPSVEHIEHACRKAFEIPEFIKSPKVVWAIFVAWCQEQRERFELKKNSTVSQDSAESTPALSASTA
jgi:hypothetical protein